MKTVAHPRRAVPLDAVCGPQILTAGGDDLGMPVPWLVAAVLPSPLLLLLSCSVCGQEGT